MNSRTPETVLTAVPPGLLTELESIFRTATTRVAAIDMAYELIDAATGPVPAAAMLRDAKTLIQVAEAAARPARTARTATTSSPGR